MVNPGGTLRPIWVISQRLAPFAAQQHLVLAIAFFEGEYPFLFHTGFSPFILRRILTP
jgi:hypothetical protein